MNKQDKFGNEPQQPIEIPTPEREPEPSAPGELPDINA